jgi:hypothetical protein
MNEKIAIEFSRVEYIAKMCAVDPLDGDEAWHVALLNSVDTLKASLTEINVL